MISCIVLAAGVGRRMECQDNKVFLPIGSKSLIQWTLRNVSKVSLINEIIVVVAEHEIQRMESEVKKLKFSGNIKIVIGGKERQDSVANGLAVVNSDSTIVLVHDGARPLATAALFNNVIDGAIHYGAAVTAVPSTDTVKRVDSQGKVLETLNRNELYNMQTPQGFQKEIFKKAHQFAKDTAYMGTDDVSLVEHLGEPVQIVRGDYKNIKVTTPNDIIMAKRYLGVEEQKMRVGFGYDIHQLKENRPCILGGVHIDSPIGPDGHSDADVLIHALMDALLGAAGLRDIGYYFPPEDSQYKGISSLLLLEKVNSLLKEQGLHAYNIDVMVIAEMPKLKTHIEMMKVNLEKVLHIPLHRISIKATTNEMLGAIGRREGIAAQAVVTLYEGEV